MDNLTVNVEARSNDIDEIARTEAAKALQQQVKNMVGVTAKVNVKSEGEVARSQGKAQRVVDLRKS
jgi:phenylacetate-CoA ligase